MRAAEPEIKIILCGAIAALTSIAVHNIGDPFGGPSATAMLWLEGGLAIAVCRKVAASDVAVGVDRRGARRTLPPARRLTAAVGRSSVRPDRGAASPLRAG